MKKNQPLVIALCVVAILVCGIVVFKTTSKSGNDSGSVEAITKEIQGNAKGPDLPPDPGAVMGGGRRGKGGH